MELDKNKNLIINGESLKSLFNRIIKADQQFIIDKDYYWNIPSENLYNVNQKPVDLNIGQISSDWEELEELLSSNDESIVFHDLGHLSAILRAIADTDQT